MDKTLTQITNSPYFKTIGPRVVSVILVALLAISAAKLTWAIVVPPTADVQAPPAPVTVATSSQNDSRAFQTASTIAQRNLFGKPDAVRPAVVDAPETQLNLTLTGILSIGDVDGIAIISQGSGSEDIYKVGDSVPGNATVREVYADRVLLDSSRGLEVLTLPRDQADITFSGEPRDLGYEVAPAANNTSISSALRELRDQFASNPAAMSRIARIVPERDAGSGNMIGLRVESLGTNPDFDQLFDQLQLQSGDVLTRLNGYDLTTPSDSLSAMRELMKADALEITVLRNGSPVDISHNNL